MSHSPSSDDADPAFQIAPMVDVVFVLMLFFMASASSLTVEKEFNVQLPSRLHGPTINEPLIIIDISPEGQVTMNNQPFGTPSDRKLQALRDWLKEAIAQFGNESAVIVRPNPEAKHERIMDVLSALGGAGVKRLTFS